jgi:hypothetical protein
MDVFQVPAREVVKGYKRAFQAGKGSDSLVNVDQREDYLYAGSWNGFDLSFLFGGRVWTET